MQPRIRLFDAAWLLIVAVYIAAGLPLATFHGDEAMQIYMSRDYETAFISRQPHKLTVQPPYAIDEDNWLRILNGSVNRYAIGLSWHLAGFTAGDLPPRPGWDWGLSYERGVETGHRPGERLLNVSRASSALFLAFSAWLMFGIGWKLGGRLPAWFISGLYALNPVILLNGRRAMMEGSLLFFGLLTIVAAALISHNLVQRRGSSEIAPGSSGRREWLSWLLLALAGGLTLASKHSGVVFVAGAWGWVLVTAAVCALARNSSRVGRAFSNAVSSPLSITESQPSDGGIAFLLRSLFILAAAGLLALGLFVALSPALWNDLPARLRDLVEQRQGLLDIQVQADPRAPTALIARLEGMITQPFMAAPMHYESLIWAESPAVRAEIAAYMASPVSGLQFGVLLGLPLTLLAGVGLLALVWPRLFPRRWWMPGLVVWVLVTAASLLVNPLPWQRYSLPWLPPVIVLAGVGLLALLRRRETSPVAEWNKLRETNV